MSNGIDETVNELEAENAALHAEVERLRAAAERVLSDLNIYGIVAGGRWDDLRTALAQPEVPSQAQMAKWEHHTVTALRVLRELAEVAVSGEAASSGYLRQRCGLSADEWHGHGEVMASLLCFAADKDWLEWHAKEMTECKPSALAQPEPELCDGKLTSITVQAHVCEKCGWTLPPAPQPEPEEPHEILPFPPTCADCGAIMTHFFKCNNCGAEPAQPEPEEPS